MNTLIITINRHLLIHLIALGLASPVCVAIASERVLLSQPVTKGRVVDSVSNEPLSGVSIQVKGTSQGTQTEDSGQFTLSAKPGNTLVVTRIGYEPKEIVLTSTSPIEVKLVRQDEALDEVVVVGYGTQRVTNLTGSVSSVDFEQPATESRMLTNLSSALSGLAPGVVVRQGQGSPTGDNAAIRVRGIGSLNAGQAPLVLIDGLPGDMNSLNPNDVSSVSVLKDAASAAIYGSRASNGVILVTTKAGRNDDGKVTFDYSGNTGWARPANLFEVVSNTADYMGLVNLILANSGESPQFTDGKIDEWRQNSPTDPLLYPNTNWWDAVLKTNIVQTHTLSARGGSEKTNFYTSFGYLNNNGLIDNTAYNRFTFRNNLSYRINNWLRFGSIITAMFDKSDPAETSSIFQWFQATTPGMLPKHPDGRYGGPMTGETTANNPVRTLESALGKDYTQQYTGKLSVIVNPVAGLELTGSYFIDMTNADGWSSNRPANLWDFQQEVITHNTDNTRLDIQNTFTKGQRHVVDLFGTYRFEVTEHHFNLLAGFNQEYVKQNGFNARKYDLISLDIPVLDAASSDPQAGGNTSDYAMRSFFSRLNYDFDNKYLLEANIRADGSSRFNKDNRWGIFPSVSAGWVTSEEPFWAGLKPVVNHFKLRASLGTLGNNSIGNYDWQNVYSPSNHSFGSAIVQGIARSAIANNVITWETTRVLNGGIDISLFNKLSATIDFYDKFTYGILARDPIPYVNGGLSAPMMNSAQVRNRGIEFNLNYQKRLGELELSIGANGAFNKNRIEKYKGDYIEPRGSNAAWVEGQPVGIFWIREVDHIVQEQQEVDQLIAQGWTFHPATPSPGDFRYRDADGNQAINDEDRVLKGNPIPLFTYGGNISLAYKGIDLYLLVNGVAGWDKYLSDSFYSLQPGIGGLYSPDFFQSWTADNPSMTIPRLLRTDTRNNQVSDYYLRKADYLRIKTMQLGYRLPDRWTSSAKLKSIRIFANLENYFTFTSFPGLDPESDSNFTYPLLKTMTFGLNVNF